MITIGTDCSGIEAPIEALKQLGIPFQHKWSCEIDKFARQSIMANSPPEVMYTDITERDHSQLPDVDLYVCGFPCQSFSLMGKRKGTRDPRGNIMLQCIDVVRKKQPRVFILENVKHFKFIEEGKPFQFLMHELESIEDNVGEPIYNVYANVYNTRDYGIPQNRERLYIIGIKKEIQLEEYIKPSPVSMKPIDDFICDKTIKNMPISKSLQRNIDKTTERTLIVTPFTYYFPIVDVCPTITTNCHCLYHKVYKRTLTVDECFLLQGFGNFNKVVSKTQLYKQIGNSMSVNVLKVILAQIIKTTMFQYILG